MVNNSLGEMGIAQKKMLLKQILGKAANIPSGVLVQDIAIIGISGHYPMSDGLEQLWDNLKRGASCISEVPEERWKASDYFDPSREDKEKAYTRWGGFIDDHDKFDARLFRISPKDAEAMDPQERLLLQTVWETFEDACYSRNNIRKIAENTGVFMGAMNSDYEFIAGEAWAASGKAAAHSSFWSLANRISYFFDLKGPSMTVDTACSSSLTAIHLACESLRKGECEAAIAGGVNLILHPAHYVRLCKMEMLSSGDRCSAFGGEADGFVDGEGVGAVLLKPLEQAIKDGDRIHGVIKGSFINASGKTSGYTVPNPSAQRKLVAASLEKAGVHPRTISYVEAHGTGTVLGDPIEISALTGAYRADTDERGYCAIGSIKSNIGHLESAAGIAGLAKVLLQMKHGKLVPSIHAERLNSKIAFEDSPFYVQQELQDWLPAEVQIDGETKVYPLRAGISSFGAGGANAHIIVEHYERARSTEGSHQGEGPHLFVMSAQNTERLKAYTSDLSRYLDRHPELNMRDAAYCLQIGRELMDERLAILAFDVVDLVQKLDRYGKGETAASDIWSGHAKQGKAAMEAAMVEACLQQRLLPQLAQAWVDGAFINWEALYDSRPAKVDMPFYSFGKERYWVQYERPAIAPNGRDEESGIYYYSPVLIPSPLNRAQQQAETFKRALLFGGNEAAAKRLEERLQCSVVQAHFGDRFAQTGNRKFTIALAEEGVCERLFESLQATGPLPDAIIYLSDSPGLTAMEEMMNVLRIVQAGCCIAGSSLKRFLYAYETGSDSAVWKQSLAACSNSLKLLVPQMAYSAIRLSDREGGISGEAAMDMLSDELLSRAAAADGDVEYGAGKRSVRRLQQLALGSPAKAKPIRSGGVCLIAGGMGALAVIFARHMAESGADVYLIGRSAPDSGRLLQLNDQLARGSGNIRYISADITDLQAMLRAVQQVNGQSGPITSVICAAGTVGEGHLLNRDAHQMAATLPAKINGTAVLDEATRSQPLELFMLCSSISSMIGDFGQCDYAVSNRFLDVYAGYREELRERGERNGRTVAIGWPLWEQGGMHLNKGAEQLYLQSSGMRPIGEKEGIAALERVLSGIAHEPVVMVFAGEKARIEGITGLSARYTLPDGNEDKAEDTGGWKGQLDADLRGMAAAIIGYRPERLASDQSLGEYGFDSIGLRQLTESMNKAFGIELNPTVFFAHSTISALCGFLLEDYREQVKARYAPAVDQAAISWPASASGLDREMDQPIQAQAAHAVGHGTEQRQLRKEPVAIVGMAGIMPGSDDLETFWRHLEDGTELVTEVPAERWDWRPIYGDPLQDTRKTNSKWGAFIPDADKFDAPFFQIPPIEARMMDPQQRLFLQSAWSAIEHAGYNPRQFHERRTGVYAGAQFNDYSRLAEHAEGAAAQAATGNALSMIANRVSYMLQLNGPSVTIDTACSSSLVAVHQAVRAIQGGECEQAIAGGVSLMLTPDTMVGASQLGVLSHEGKCKTFDKDANGYVKGEGIGVIVLKLLSQAEADGDTVYAVIKGGAVNHGGRAQTLTSPNSKAQAALLAESFKEAGFAPDTISYLELHGTGTALGDPVEVDGIKQAFRMMGNGGTSQRDPGYCSLGTVKTNIGHLEPASGIAGLLKVVLAMRHGKIPGVRHLRQLNPLLQLDHTPFAIETETVPWEQLLDSSGKPIPRRAGVSSFGFGGANAHIALEEHSDNRGQTADGDDHLPPLPILIVLSAPTRERLLAQAARLLEAIRAGQLRNSDLPSAAYTLQIGREAWQERMGCIVTSIEELEARLAAYADGHEAAQEWHQGNVERDRAALEALGEGEDLAQVAARWIVKGEYGKLLDSWAKGLPVDWNTLYAGTKKPRRIALPAYAFAKHRYWVPSVATAVSTAQARQGAASLAVEADESASRLHPLLHENISDLSGIRFRSRFTGEERFLSDHVVNGQRILPGAVCLELAREAALRAYGQESSHAIRLLHVAWLRPAMAGRQGLQVEIVLRDSANGRLQFDLYGGEPEASGFELLCTGTAVRTDGSDRTCDQADMDRLLREHAGETVSAQQFYERFEAAGTTFGPAHRAVERVHLGSESALAKLKLPTAVSNDAGCWLHPSMLDGAMQAASVLMRSHAGGGASLAIGLDRLDVFTSTGAEMWVVVNRRTALAASAVQSFDIELRDRRGNLCVFLSGFASKTAGQPSPIASGEENGPPIGDVLMAPVWDAVRFADISGDPSLSETERVLVIASEDRRTGPFTSRYPHAAKLVLHEETVEEIAAKLNRLGDLGHIVWIAGNSEGTADGNDEAIMDRQKNGILQLFRVIQSVAKAGYGSRKLGWTIVTEQCRSIGQGDVADPAHASVHGLIGSAAKEYPGWEIRLIDVEAAVAWPMEEMLRLKADPRGEPYVWRNGQWHRQRLALIADSGALMNGQAPLYKQGGVYLVIGGAGTIGEAWSSYMIRTYGATIIWIGRRPLDAAVEQKISRLAKLGPAPIYVEADASEPGRLEAVRNEVTGRFGRLNGVVHAAAHITAGDILELQEEAYGALLQSKLEVSVRMKQAFGQAPLDFILFFSSINSFLQARKQSVYAAGCLISDEYAAWLAATMPCAVKVIHWGYWNMPENSENADTFRYWCEQNGIGCIEPAEGMKALEMLMAGPLDRIAFMKTTKIAGYEGLVPLKGEALRVYSGETKLDIEQVKRRIRMPLEKSNGLMGPMLDIDEHLCRLLLVQLGGMNAFEAGTAEAFLSGLPEVQRKLYASWHEETLSILARHGKLLFDGTQYRLPEAAELLDYASAWEQWEARKKVWLQDERQASKLRLVEVMLKALPPILNGERPATEYMFPNGTLELVESVYKHTPVAEYFNEVASDAVVAYVEERRAHDPGARIRLLEIGAGTGGTSSKMFAKLAPFRENIGEYAYTDISRAFLLHAKKTYGEQAPYLACKLLNIDEPLEGQNIDLGQYDVVIATNVLHATRNIRTTVRHAKALMRANGMFVINELTDKSLFTHLTFGLLEGWWLYEDAELRIPNCPGLYLEGWEQLLKEEGFASAFAPAYADREVGQQVIVSASDGIVRLEGSFTADRLVMSKGDERHGEPERVLAVEPVETQQQHAGLANQPAPRRMATGAGDGEMMEFVRSIIKSKLSEAVDTDIAAISNDMPFAEFGVDSILGIHLVQTINRALGTDLSTTSIFDFSTINKLAAHLVASYKPAIMERMPRSMPEQEAGPRAGQQVVPATGRSHSAEAQARQAQQEQPEQLAPSYGQSMPAQPSCTGIAVIGMSGQFPDAANIDAFWENLCSGHDAVRELPSQYLDQQKLFSSKRTPGKTYCKWGGVLEERDCFDPLFFNISPREAASMNPHQRLILQESWKALENAGYNPKTLAGTNTSMFIGAEPTGYFNETFTGFSDAIVASRLSYYLNLNGPAVVINTGCSSSGVALHMACESLRSGESSIAVAGGAAAYLNGSTLATLSEIEMLSPTGKCHTFDTAADGTVLSEGVGIVILKRLEEAIQDGDPIWGVIKASGINQDGASNGITAPSGAAQERLLTDVYRKYSINPADITYVEAHGTGTKLGDPIETNALVRTFKAFTDKQQYCAIGTAKPYIGHTGAAAGVIGLMKVLLSMRHRMIPGLIHYEKLNPFIELAGSPFYLNTETMAWKGNDGKPLMATVNSFGHSGTNAHLVVQEHIPAVPSVSRMGHTPQSGPILIPLSAKNKDRLLEYAASLLAYVQKPYGRESISALGGSHNSSQQDAAVHKQLDQAELVNMLARILQVDPSVIDPNEAFHEYGVEQLHLMQLQQRVWEEAGAELPAELLSSYGSLAAIAQAGPSQAAGNKGNGIATNGQLTADGLHNIGYTLQTGREAMEERVIFLVNDPADLITKLEAFLHNRNIDGCWRSKTKEDNDMVRLFDSDEELQDVIAQWLAKGQWEKIAKLWANRVHIEWELFYGNDRPVKLHLPAYPFAKERYGLAGPDERRMPEQLAAFQEQVPLPVLHPLVQRNVSDLTEQKYESRFTGEEFFLADHVIRNQRVLPGAAQLEMFRAAVELAAGAMKGESAHLQLRQIVWARPVTVEAGPVELAVGLQANSEGAIELELRSAGQPRGKGAAYSHGLAAYVDAGTMPPVALDSLSANCNAALDAQQCQEAFGAMGIHYGPSFRGLENVLIGTGYVLAKLSLPMMDHSHHHTALHPGMLDSALQAAIGLVLAGHSDGQASKPMLPFALEQLDVYAPLVSSMWAYVRYSGHTKANSAIQKLDIDLCDEQGCVHVRLQGFTVRMLDGQPALADGPGAMVGSAGPADSGTILIKPTWQLLPQAASGHVGKKAAEGRRRLMLIGFTPSVSAQLEKLLKGSIALSLPERKEKLADQFHRASAAVFEQVREALMDKSAAPPIVQIVAASREDACHYAGLAAMLKTARLENPKLNAQLIETDSEEADTVMRILERHLDDGNLHIRYRGETAHTPGWSELVEQPDPAAELWKDGGVYLITGGNGGLGLLFAEEIARTAKHATIVLAGRSALKAEKQALIDSMRSAGADVWYEQADITSWDGVSGLVDAIVSRSGRLDGILHCAGIIRDQYIIKKEVEQFKEVLAPKVKGTAYLDEKTKRLKLDFFLLFSSGSAAFGNAGQADYSTANAFMDAFSACRNQWAAEGRRFGRTLSVNWPLWADGGMQVGSAMEGDMLDRLGMQAMSVPSGMAALREAYASGCDQVAVVAGNKAKIRRNLAIANGELLSASGEASASAPTPAPALVVHSTPSTEAEPAATEQANEADVRAAIMAYLRKLLSGTLGLQAGQMEDDRPLEQYGLDSVMVLDVNNKLESHVPNLPKTLFFEYSTLVELADYFLREHRNALGKLLGDSIAKPARVSSAPVPAAAIPVANTDDNGEPQILAMQRRFVTNAAEARPSAQSMIEGEAAQLAPTVTRTEAAPVAALAEAQPVHAAMVQPLPSAVTQAEPAAQRMTIDDWVASGAAALVQEGEAHMASLSAAGVAEEPPTAEGISEAGRHPQAQQSGSMLVHEAELERDAEAASTIAKLDEAHPPVGYERILYPHYFISANRDRYVKVTVNEETRLIIPFMPVEQPIYEELATYCSQTGYQLLMVDFRRDWVDPAAMRQVPLGVWQNLDINSFTLSGNKMRKLRYLVDKFRKAGHAAVEEYDRSKPLPLGEMKRLMLRWGESKNNIIRHSLLCMEDLLERRLPEDYRAFLTYLDGQLCSVIVVERTSEGAYLMDQEFYDPKTAPLGHMEYAITEIMQMLKQENAKQFSLGLTWYPFAFEDVPGSDAEAWQWLQEQNEKKTLLGRIFSQGQTNYQFKKKFGEIGEPIMAYMPRTAPPTLLLQYWPVFYQNSITAVELRRAMEHMPSCGAADHAGNAPWHAGLAAEDREELLNGPIRLEHLDYNANPLDLMTDSWGIVRSHAVRQRMDELQGSKMEAGLEPIRALFPFKHLIVTTEGKTAESLFYQAFGSTNKKIVSTIPWTTTLMHQLNNGFDVIELPHESLRTMDGAEAFKGEFDLALLEESLRGNSDIAMAGLELLSNASGGGLVRLSHIREAKQLLQRHNIPLVIDASRAVRNAMLLQRFEPGCAKLGVWDIFAQTMAQADHVVTSLTKDYAVPFGGLVATNDDELANRIVQLRSAQGFTLSEQSERMVLCGLADQVTMEKLVRQQLDFTGRVGDMLKRMNIGCIQPVAGHAVVIDSEAIIPGEFTTLERKEKLLRLLFAKTGIRGGIHQVGKQRNTMLNRCIRLAFPLGLSAADEQLIISALEPMLHGLLLTNDLVHS
ncbi:SDR family NAD(P)-dependent oxidoreductase [Paenibacillus sp. MMS18-CY102]|uniref:SDR family NAD(P)-dependent oxidoreductase n=1 Tax=Paenibacillus sp. MMS18-CY102 TaxID=2682849 RepID=UPI001366767F|nr:SDR family NAD(P)-dependent oxidoreductase [Paenibacillus sp. MMS18-CY102]MWC28302.1 SDR family NAD(P)-dependent oxidoreductase [Paenibacillus sp. MMS18-CY102]